MPADPGPVDSVLVLLTGIGIVFAILLLLLFLRVLREFRKSSAHLAGFFRSLAPGPEILLDRKIKAGAAGSIMLSIADPGASLLENIVLVISPQPGLDLREDHLMIPRLEPGDQRVFRIGYGPAAPGQYLIRIAVRYRAGGRDRFLEYSRFVLADPGAAVPEENITV